MSLAPLVVVNPAAGGGRSAIGRLAARASRRASRGYRGTHVNHPAVRMRSGATDEADGDGDTRIHLDREPFGRLPLYVTISHRALEAASSA